MKTDTAVLTAQAIPTSLWLDVRRTTVLLSLLLEVSNFANADAVWKPLLSLACYS